MRTMAQFSRLSDDNTASGEDIYTIDIYTIDIYTIDISTVYCGPHRDGDCPHHKELF